MWIVEDATKNRVVDEGYKQISPSDYILYVNIHYLTFFAITLNTGTNVRERRGNKKGFFFVLWLVIFAGLHGWPLIFYLFVLSVLF